MELKDRIKTARKRKGLTQEELALAVEKTRGAVSQWEAGENRPRHDTLRLIAETLGVSLVWLQTGVDEPPNARIGPKAKLKQKRMRVIQGAKDVDVTHGSGERSVGTETGRRGLADDEVPEIDVVAGLGGGGIAVTTEVTAENGASFSAEVVRDYWRIPERLLWHSNASPKHIAAIPVQGDSMAPTIIDGDVVFIDTRHRVPSPPGLYALADEFGGLIIKRLEVVSKPSDEYVEVSIISDNQNHKTRILTLQEIAIVGRVVGRFTTT